MRNWHEFVDYLSEEELGILMILAYQVYEDGNLYEWFCDVTDLNPDAYRQVFEEVTALANEDGSNEGTEGQDRKFYTDDQDRENYTPSYEPGSGESNDMRFGTGEEQDGFMEE